MHHRGYDRRIMILLSRAQTPLSITLVMCGAEALGMMGFATFASLLPGFFEVWGLSNTEAGWIGGIFFAGYVAAVPVLSSLTDRVPARRVYYVSLLISAASSMAFAFFADGFWSAFLFRALAGVGLAGTYMPGLKILSDHIEGHERQSRGVSFYTASFGIGAALSYLMAGELDALLGWQVTFFVAGAGPVLGFFVLHFFFPKIDPVHGPTPDTHLLDFRPVFRARPAMGFVLGYAAHNFELFAFRSWVVAFVVFAQGLDPTSVIISATAYAAFLNVAGLPASIFGNELCVRFGRRRVITTVMLISSLLAMSVGFSAALPFWAFLFVLLLYDLTVMGESAALTAGVVEVAPHGYRGATMAVYAGVGFFGAFLGPLLFGMTLDLVGGDARTVPAWGAAFALLGLVVALGPLALRWAAVSRAANRA